MNHRYVLFSLAFIFSYQLTVFFIHINGQLTSLELVTLLFFTLESSISINNFKFCILGEIQL